MFGIKTTWNGFAELVLTHFAVGNLFEFCLRKQIFTVDIENVREDYIIF